ncbi:hypothetical protein SLEP1_g32735 [Rubroshorea leprosula]|uniref:F-box/kelch-repeat protein n=1 Tax=Rubroshorea leprosula TaxID=152421 RepID=A0AAV5KEC6_9ROSI|nr:hypothetical protein SLEP1_g32735 [Rubroshorea leprosula]
MAEEQKLQMEREEVAVHGDLLEAIFCHVPLVHLLPACDVSKFWNRAVSSSLRHFNRPKPWFIVHTQRSRPPYAIATYAYDPRSNLWLKIHHQTPIQHVSNLRSAHSTLLYMLSPSKFSFSFDPLHLKWHSVDPPRVWRTDPIVAVLGHHVVVAGGAFDFEDDPLAVEVYNLKTRSWDTCQSMPAALRHSAAPTWLSTAANENKMLVMEKSSGVGYSFDPNSKIWYGPYDLRPDGGIYSSVIGFCGDRLILVGLVGEPEKVTDVKLWEFSGEELEFREQIGVMPEGMLKKMIGEGMRVSSIGMCSTGDFLFLHNPEDPAEVVVCEIVGEGAYQWRSVKNAVDSDESRLAERVIFTCSAVGLGDMRRAFGSERRSFTVLNR